MGFKRGYEAAEWYTGLLGTLFKYILIPALGGFIMSVLLDMLFDVAGLHKVPLFARLEQWGGWIAGLYFLYLMAGGSSKRPTVSQASVTSRTGVKLKAGVYNLPTLEKDIRTVKITNPYRHTLGFVNK